MGETVFPSLNSDLSQDSSGSSLQAANTHPVSIIQKISDPAPQRRPSRKSVSFTNEKVVVEADGSVRKLTQPDDYSANNSTALAHAPQTPPLSAALQATMSETAMNGATDGAAEALASAELDLSLMKKKKSKKAAVAENENAELPAEGTTPDGDDGGDGLDLTALKKKKKRNKKTEDDFAKKLEALDLAIEGGADGAEEDAAGDWDAGTGIFEHNETQAIPFPLLLSRLYQHLLAKNPNSLDGTTKKTIPPPQCFREGSKKTQFANMAEICKKLKRSDEHLTSYLFAELGTSGSAAQKGNLIIKGRFQGKQIEAVLRKYIMDYVACKTCRSLETELQKGENRLYFVTCQSCGSRRAVPAIKAGFSAQIGKRKKKN